MHAIVAGFLAGAAAGVIMGVIAHILFKLRVFRSSLIVIDGSFLFRMIGRDAGPGLVAAAGLMIHLVTSAVFGALYFVATGILGKDASGAAWSLLLMGLYVALLWLSMLFIALPIAGQGILGRRSGRYSWLEQLILHAIFFIAYTTFVRIII
ncbi:MAG: hypothetical protein H6Q52_1502 [Deltaproteobacteria bacterium]|nr:hypothetical protein [Deltaproteobacteria bacterium]